jgi:hypothetical protein
MLCADAPAVSRANPPAIIIAAADPNAATARRCGNVNLFLIVT